MKEISADFLRQEVARLGELVVETAIYHESGMKLFSAGDAITLAHAKALHASGIANLLLLEYDEDARNVRKTLGVDRVPPRDIVAGDVLMDDVDCQQVEAQTVSGNVRFGGPVAKGGRYELSSHSGNVSVALGGSTGFEVEATSFSGSIKSDFSFNNSPGDSGNSRWRKSIRGVYGDGSAILEITTFSGNVIISKR